MAKSIISVSISAHSLFGILNVSQQDSVGDLVYMDFDKGVQTLYAHAVSDAVELRRRRPFHFLRGLCRSRPDRLGSFGTLAYHLGTTRAA